jgi:hypothetical protein
MSHVVDPNIIVKAIEGLINTLWKITMDVEYIPNFKMRIKLGNL